MATARNDGRKADQLRPLKITRNYTEFAEGSVLIEIGKTKVICNASVENRVPGFLRDTGKGWITAEYSMLPRATGTRGRREASAGKVGGRTMEIQRLIGRSLRAIADLESLGERSIWVDCDVIQADGGTRTASITGAYVALYDALRWMQKEKMIPKDKWPLTGHIAAISVGIVDGQPLLDLNYPEDSAADVDMNLVMTDKGRFVEIQGSGEESTFSKAQLNKLLTLGSKGIEDLIAAQRKALKIKK